MSTERALLLGNQTPASAPGSRSPCRACLTPRISWTATKD